MEYTKKQSLLDCVEVWSELAKTGDKYKPACPACSYVNANYYAATCAYCPLYGRWVKGDPDSTCTQDYSIFTRWLREDGKHDSHLHFSISTNPRIGSRRYWARQIVKACEEALAELEEE